MKKKKKILFIINPISGVSKKSRVSDQIAEHLDHNKYDAEIRYTLYKHHSILLTEEAVAAGFDIVVAVGGDGSVHEVSSVLVGTNTALGIIPLGSGNGWARHFGIPLNVEKAIKLFNNCKTVTTDSGLMNGKHFINCAGVGFDATVASHFAETRLRGFWSYAYSTFKMFLTFKPTQYEVEVDDKKYQGSYFMISVMNGSQFGYNVKSIPSADPSDGLLDVLFLKKFNKSIVFFITLRVLFNQLDKSRYAQVLRGKEIKISMKEQADLQLDGEPVNVKKHVQISCTPHALKMIIAK